jgi:hypothetical protein
VSAQSVSAMGRHRGAAGSRTHWRVREPRPRRQVHRGLSESPRWGSPLPTAAPTGTSPRAELPGRKGPDVTTSIGTEPGPGASAATSRAERRTDLGEPSTRAGSARQGLLGRPAATQDARLGDAGPRSRVGERRPPPPVRPDRSYEAGTTGVPERRPQRGGTAPWPIVAVRRAPAKVLVDNLDWVFGTHNLRPTSRGHRLVRRQPPWTTRPFA